MGRDRGFVGRTHAARTAEKHRVTFDSEAAAAASGYRPDRDCFRQ
jgi:hypothetical protein